MTNLENTGYIIYHHIPIFLAVNHGKLHEFQSDPGLSEALPAGCALPACRARGIREACCVKRCWWRLRGRRRRISGALVSAVVGKIGSEIGRLWASMVIVFRLMNTGIAPLVFESDTSSGNLYNSLRWKTSIIDR